jgi:Cu+-exporting ATPase
VVEIAEEKGLKFREAKDFQAAAGGGVRARLDGTRVLLGNLRFLSNEGVDVTGGQQRSAELEAQAKTVIGLAQDEELAGLLSITDATKDDAAEAIQHMKEASLRPVMITGDNEQTARAVAVQVGIEEVYAQVLPQEKAGKVRELQKRGFRVAMVGDGINDAPALARADVGIAMGTGTDIAIEAGDVALLRGDLRSVTDAVRLSRRTMATMRQNLFWAFVYNVLGIPIAAGALYPSLGILLSPILASAAMAMSSVSVVTNSLRLARFRPA